MATWSELVGDAPHEIFQLADAYKQRDMVAVERFAARHDMELETVKRRAQEFFLYSQLFSALPAEGSAQEWKLFPPPRKLHDIPGVMDVERQDTKDFQNWLEGFAAENRRMTIMRGGDIHFPDHDVRALDIWYQMVEQYQPDLVIVGDDDMDFTRLSRFKADPMYKLPFSDDLKLMKFYHHRHVAEIKRRAPNARLIYLPGNHNIRLDRYAKEQAPELAESTIESFIEAIRSDGDVWYVGNIRKLRIANLLLQHGKRSTKYTAANTLADVGFQVNVWAQHVHRTDEYSKQGEDFIAQAITSGCLCRLIPHYAQEETETTRWNHGAGVASVNLHGLDVEFINPRFHQAEDGRLFTSINMREYWSTGDTEYLYRF